VRIRPRGEIFGFSAANGLWQNNDRVKMLAGLLRPSSGQVRLFHPAPVDGRVPTTAAAGLGTMSAGRFSLV